MIRRLSLAALSLFTLALLAHSSAVAQEKDAPKPDLLRQYLSEKDAAKKKELRAKLVALGAPALREAISQLGFEKPKELGSLEFATKCPDGFEHPYFMHVPPQYETGKRYPLVIWLHGGVNGAPAEAASSAIEMWQQALGDKWANEVMVLAPACIAQDTTEDAFWWRDKGQRNVLHMLREVKQRFNVDDNKVFITGMVARPGGYPITARMTVLQLIALAGGLQEYADREHVVVVRLQDGRQTSYRFNYKEVAQQKRIEQNLELKAGDTVLVP